jgi:hypothetical protein
MRLFGAAQAHAGWSSATLLVQGARIGPCVTVFPRHDRDGGQVSRWTGLWVTSRRCGTGFEILDELATNAEWYRTDLGPSSLLVGPCMRTDYLCMEGD